MTSRLLSFLLFLAVAQAATAAPVTVLLRLQPRVSMEELAKQVSDPHSPRFRRFFTPDEIREISAPSEKDYQALLERIRESGMTISHESSTHLWLAVQADSALAEHVFSAKIKQLPGGRRRLTSQFQIPSAWALVAGLTGLDSQTPRHANFHIAPQDDANMGVSADKIKSIYGIDAIARNGITGAGQHISIATYDDTNLDDIREYFRKIGLNPVPTVDKIAFNGPPPADDQFNLETTMDAELAGMIAPGAQIHIYTSSQNEDAAEALMFTTIFDDNRARTVNYSWSSCEKLLTPNHRKEMQPLFQRAVAQGINVLVASGDTGAASCEKDNSIQPAWPSTDPNVVVIGGTTLTINNDSAVETGWGPCGIIDGCSGGGVSTLSPLPSYQKNFPAPFTMRSYPDLSFNADLNVSGEPIWVNYNGKVGWNLVGGTSMAAPQWCGLMALIGQARAAAGKETIGFINPLIYELTEKQRGALLNDISQGTNGQYDAGPGWDAVTGWGSPKAGAFLDFLLNQ